MTEWLTKHFDFISWLTMDSDQFYTRILPELGILGEDITEVKGFDDCNMSVFEICLMATQIVMVMVKVFV